MTAKKRKQTFVLVVPTFEDIFHSFYAGEIIKGVSLAASRLKTDVLIHLTSRVDHRGWLDSTLLDHRYVDGVIFADIDNDLNVVKKTIRSGMPCLVLNNMLAEPINCISINNQQAAFEIVEYLIKLGHRKVATIAGDLNTQAGLMRLEGYRQALQKYHISFDKNYVTQGGFLRTPSRAAAEKLLSLKDRPTAIFAASDVMAMELMDVAKKKNLHVPEDLSVFGFDDNPVNATCSVPLSTVPQPLIEMGRLGAENLNEIARGKAQLPVKIMLTAKLLKRASTAALAV